MHDPIAAILQREPFVILDGGSATELEAQGYVNHTHLWSAAAIVDAPDLVASVHQRYLRAGADIITTMTYQASHDGFRRIGLSTSEAEKAMQRGITIAMEEATRRDGLHYVATSIGPYGAYLADGSEYTGHYRIDDRTLKDFHRRRLESFLTAGSTFLAVETIPTLFEAHIIVELMHEYRVKGWVSFGCRNAEETYGGDDLALCIRQLEHSDNVAALGVNCTHPQYMLPIMDVLKDNSMGPYLLYPNSGEPFDNDSHTWVSQDSAPDYYILGSRWYSAGARVIGGCCRMTAKDIGRLSDLRIDVKQGARI